MLATFASLIAPFGGFFASGLKRAFKIKDFGDSIPGHGGMTDRMDCQFMMVLLSHLQLLIVGILQSYVLSKLYCCETCHRWISVAYCSCGVDTGRATRIGEGTTSVLDGARDNKPESCAMSDFGNEIDTHGWSMIKREVRLFFMRRINGEKSVFVRSEEWD